MAGHLQRTGAVAFRIAFYQIVVISSSTESKHSQTLFMQIKNLGNSIILNSEVIFMAGAEGLEPSAHGFGVGDF